MKGFTTLFYLLLFMLMFVIQRGMVLGFLGSFSGVPMFMGQYLISIQEDLKTNETITLPLGYATFMANCNNPASPEIDTDDFEAVNLMCGEGYPSVICLFHNYYEHRFRRCRGLSTVFDKQYYYDDTEARILKVTRGEEVSLTEVTASMVK